MSKKKKNQNKPKKVQTPVIPDKLPYSKGEKTAELTALVLAIASLVTQLALLISGMRGTGVVVTAIFTALEYGAFTYGSAYPHRANVVFDKSMINEQVFRSVRKSCIGIKMIIVAALTVLAIFVLK